MLWWEFIYAYRELKALKVQYTTLYMDYAQERIENDKKIRGLLKQLAEERHLQGMLVDCVSNLRVELKKYRGW